MAYGNELKKWPTQRLRSNLCELMLDQQILLVLLIPQQTAHVQRYKKN